MVEGDHAGRRPRLLVLGAGPGQLGLLAAARARGLFVVAADRDPRAPGFRYADRRALVSVEDERGAERLAEAERVDGVIAPGIDWPVAIAARIADRLGLPHPISPAAAALATSKLRQRDCFARAGVPQPRFELCQSVEEAAAAAHRIGYPCVVKPPDRQGQRGLALARDRDELAAAAAAALESSRARRYLVEEYARGREVTVNAFSLRGRFVPLTVTDRDRADGAAFGVALAHVWPSALPATQLAAAVEASRRAAEAVGIREGPTYAQVLVGGDGARVVELAARLGGGHDAELSLAALGVDLNGLALAAALGETIAERAVSAAARVGGACVRFLVSPPGELAGVDGVAAALALRGVRAATVYREPPWRFRQLRRASDRAGFVLAVGPSRAAALAHAAAAARLIRFRTVAAEPAPRVAPGVGGAARGSAAR